MVCRDEGLFLEEVRPIFSAEFSGLLVFACIVGFDKDFVAKSESPTEGVASIFSSISPHSFLTSPLFSELCAALFWFVCFPRSFSTKSRRGCDLGSAEGDKGGAVDANPIGEPFDLGEVFSDSLLVRFFCKGTLSVGEEREEVGEVLPEGLAVDVVDDVETEEIFIREEFSEFGVGGGDVVTLPRFNKGVDFPMFCKLEGFFLEESFLNKLKIRLSSSPTFSVVELFESGVCAGC